jgi:DNA-binding transcriptional MerR regulator
MITTKTLARKTGLSAKTLTRWANRGLIPRPAVSTHPSGRGKVGYWPDSVLDRCRRLVRLRKEGHSVESAVAMLGLENLNKCIAQLDQPTLADLLAKHKVKGPNGEEVDFLEVFRGVIAGSLRDSVLDRDHHRTVLHQLHADNRRLLRDALNLMQGGYRPFLTFDGTTVRIEPDFVLGFPTTPEGSSFVSLPLRPAFRKLLAVLGGEELLPEVRVEPAPKVWVREGDTIVEYHIYLRGLRGFELIRELAQTIGVTREGGSKHDQP